MERPLTYWTLAFFALSSVGRFSKSLHSPEKILNFARLQLLIEGRDGVSSAIQLDGPIQVGQLLFPKLDHFTHNHFV